MGIKKVIQSKFVELLKTNIKDDMVSELMGRYDEQIVILEDSEDPMAPSVCREEFKIFLEKSIEDSIKIEGDSIKFGVGEEEKLGIGEELDKETTDCLKIIGTIINGIIGEYVLVTSEMTGRLEGRTGRAELWTREGYDKVALMRGWNPNRPTWKFSNFEGLPNFFDVDIGKYIDKHMDKLIKGLG